MFNFDYYDLKFWREMDLEYSSKKKRKGMNKKPHKNNYKQKRKGKKK